MIYENPVALEKVFVLSKKISDEIEEYKHSEYQSAIAAIAMSAKSKFKIVVSPTGSGKTWI